MTSPQKGSEVQKLGIWGDFQGITGVTSGGRGSKNWKNGVTSFMDDPLVRIVNFLLVLTF